MSSKGIRVWYLPLQSFENMNLSVACKKFQKLYVLEKLQSNKKVITFNIQKCFAILLYLSHLSLQFK